MPFSLAKLRCAFYRSALLHGMVSHRRSDVKSAELASRISSLLRSIVN
jgi:hypothetical protein